MEKSGNEYEAVIGLEIHCELSTKTKAFCSCESAFGGEPNSRCCPVCFGLPGAMPSLNIKAAEYAVRAGVALNCSIARISSFDRKNYFYPDLPKGYQITQQKNPVCRDGFLDIDFSGSKKRIRIERIHLEEDAGKLIHRDGETLIDFNRAGVPLIEIVTRPDISSAGEAQDFVRKLRSIILCTGISDCRMNEGSLRVDVNISVKKRTDSELGIRTEIKNLNSINAIGKAIESEFSRQVGLISEGIPLSRETVRFDPVSKSTLTMRSKESDNDYRYFAEPDIPPLVLSEDFIKHVEQSMPELPEKKAERYVSFFGIPEDNAALISGSTDASVYFEKAAESCSHLTILSNMITSTLFPAFGDEGADRSMLPAPEHISEIADLSGDGTVNSVTAKKLMELSAKEKKSPREIVARDGLAVIRDRERVRRLVESAVSEMPKAKADYLRGKKAALKSIVGKAMFLSKGLADPEMLNEEAEDLLSKKE
ncbi:MAG: Asp-tRNA(Asn)/Glu-tRNA(Gln) amidotransferase subunit GatB [Clostridia bacterium]|nr:Asp-tRNA(Asn)/Glu-tRNA(Gln) amidotransferase subunit GatB [Clostridia bacterium]